MYSSTECHWIGKKTQLKKSGCGLVPEDQEATGGNAGKEEH